MQGAQALADSWLHSHICRFIIDKFRAFAELPSLLSSQGVTNIDDVLLLLKLQSKVGSGLATKLFNTLETWYKKLGYVIDRSKSLLSCRKCVLLSRYFIDGLELMLPLKTAIRTALSLNDEIPTMHDTICSIYAYCNSVEIQRGDTYILECLKCCWRFALVFGFGCSMQLGSRVEGFLA